MAIYDESDDLVASDPTFPAPLHRSQVTPVPADLIRAVSMRGGKTWHLAFLLPERAPPTPVLWRLLLLVIVVVGISSVLIGRSLVRPLRRLAAAAHDLGAGKLDTRVQMNRSDELGQVATAFDQMADRVAHALRVEKELLANVSHELRTPLQRIHIAVELAAEGDAATARDSLSEIAEDLGELERIVEDVLTASRLSLREGADHVPASAAPPLRPETVDLVGLLEKSAARFRTAHPERPLRVTLADGLPLLAADPILLRRVIDNLLDNAHKYSDDAHSEICLSALATSRGVVVEVRDRGLGISPLDLQRIFEPFFRADRSRTRTTGGLGLGLALARRIVEAHQGTLTIESSAGIGTTARIELPVVQLAAASSPPPVR